MTTFQDFLDLLFRRRQFADILPSQPWVAYGAGYRLHRPGPAPRYPREGAMVERSHSWLA